SAAGLQNVREPAYVSLHVLIAKDVEDGAIDDVIEALVPPRERKRIFDEKPGLDTSLRGAAIRFFDCVGNEVDTRHIAATRSEHERVLAGAAAGVEHFAGDLTGMFDKN